MAPKKMGKIERLECITIPATLAFELTAFPDNDDEPETLSLEEDDALVIEYATDDAEELAAWLRSLADAVESD